MVEEAQRQLLPRRPLSSLLHRVVSVRRLPMRGFSAGMKKRPEPWRRIPGGLRRRCILIRHPAEGAPPFPSSKADHHGRRMARGAGMMSRTWHHAPFHCTIWTPGNDVLRRPPVRCKQTFNGSRSNGRHEQQRTVLLARRRQVRLGREALPPPAWKPFVARVLLVCDVGREDRRGRGEKVPAGSGTRRGQAPAAEGGCGMNSRPRGWAFPASFNPLVGCSDRHWGRLPEAAGYALVGLVEEAARISTTMRHLCSSRPSQDENLRNGRKSSPRKRFPHHISSIKARDASSPDQATSAKATVNINKRE